MSDVNLDFKKRMLNIKLEGTEYKLKFPSVREIMDFSKKADSEKADEFEETLMFVSAMGMPLEVCENLEGDQLKQIVEALSGQKKS